MQFNYKLINSVHFKNYYNLGKNLAKFDIWTDTFAIGRCQSKYQAGKGISPKIKPSYCKSLPKLEILMIFDVSGFTIFLEACLRRLYEKTRLPLVPIYGFFPVKFKMFIGDPIYPKKDQTSESLSNEVMNSIGTLIYQHQRLPGNILCALIDRLV